ncbi:MAG: DNA-binding protein [Clostridia bacterium]|nr:DNA-binding protein [Clostridia bacterium]
MFEKDMSVGLLLDFYGDVLSSHTRSLLSMYYGEDLSLAEIAESEGISRQGVRHAIKKGEEELRFLEEHLGLAARFRALQAAAGKLYKAAEAVAENPEPTVQALVKEARLAAALITENEEEVTGIVSEFD